MSEVNRFDLFLLALIAMFVVIGIWRGFVREIVSLLTWVAACAIAWTFAGSLANVFDGLEQEQSLKQMLAFVVIFISVFIIGMVVGMVLHKFVNQAPGLRAANRVTGGFVGLARGVVIAVVLFLLAGLTSFPQKPWWRDALLAPAFERAAAHVARYLPPDIAKHVQYGEKIAETVRQGIVSNKP
jgi:membrane protein required for colicin V production